MAYLANITKMKPDTCERSFHYLARQRRGETLRDTYFLIDPESSPSQGLKMGYTIVYPNGKTTGHSHEEEEVYFVICGRGKMIIDEEEFFIKEGDAFYVPPGKYHVTYNTGILPLNTVWVTGKIQKRGSKKS